jgi:hypothetical protein
MNWLVKCCRSVAGVPMARAKAGVWLVINIQADAIASG